VDQETEIPNRDIQKVLSACEVDITPKSIAMVERLLLFVREKERENEKLRELLNSQSKFPNNTDNLKTLASLTGLVNLHKHDKEISEVFAGLFLSLLCSFKDEVLEIPKS